MLATISVREGRRLVPLARVFLISPSYLDDYGIPRRDYSRPILCHPFWRLVEALEREDDEVEIFKHHWEAKDPAGGPRWKRFPVSGTHEWVLYEALKGNQVDLSNFIRNVLPTQNMWGGRSFAALIEEVYPNRWEIAYS